MAKKIRRKQDVKPNDGVEYFTDEMHQDIFIFQDSLSGRGYGGTKAITKPLKIKTGLGGKTRIR